MAKFVRIIGAACCLVIVASFIAWAHDENAAATKRQVQVAGGQTTFVAQPVKHSDIRLKIDEANKVLVTPFAWVTASSSSQWVKHLVNLVLGVLLYGVFLFYLARLIPKSKPTEPSVWQA